MVGLSRKAEVPTMETEDNAEILAKEELSRLSRQLRLMENDKRAYLKESNGTLNHQTNILENLWRDHNKVLAELTNLKQKKIEEDADDTKRISEAAETCRRLNAEFKKESTLSSKICEKFKDATEKVEDLRLYVGRKEKEESSINELRNRIRIANRKLETITGKFDGVVAENADSRLAVDVALQENAAIMSKHVQQEEKVDQGKSRIQELVDQAMATYDQREEAVGKIITILERNAKEKKQNLLEMSELSRINRHEQKHLDFMSTKNKDRLFLETNEDRMTRIELAKEQVADQAVESYKHNFETLLTPSSPNLLSLVDEYADLYHKNIRRFEYINELNKDIEALLRDVTKLRSKIKSCSSEIVERNQTKNRIILMRQAALTELTSRSKEVQSMLEKFERSIQAVLASTSNLFRLTATSDEAHVLRLLGAHQDISSQNLILYMNIIEDKISEIFGRRKVGSDMCTPSRTKSPRPSSRTGSVFSASAPRKMNTPDELLTPSATIPDAEFSALVDEELDPLAYSKIRAKVRDASAAAFALSLSEDESLSSA